MDDERKAARAPTAVQPRWSGAVFVCGKCAKRHDDGKALRRALKRALRDKAGAHHRRKLRIFKTECVGLCPKQAIVVASAATLVDGEVLLIRDERDVTAVSERLLPPRESE